MPDGISADTGVGSGVPRARAYNELCGILLDEFLDADLVISEDMNGGALEHEILVNVPGERIVVVNQNKIRSRRDRRRRFGLVG